MDDDDYDGGGGGADVTGLGLGYQRLHRLGDDDDDHLRGTSAAASGNGMEGVDRRGGGGGAADSSPSASQLLVEQCLQQCLEYHERREEERRRLQREQQQHQLELPQGQQHQHESALSVEEGRRKAEAILERFRQQQRSLLYGANANADTATRDSVDSFVGDVPIVVADEQPAQQQHHHQKPQETFSADAVVSVPYEYYEAAPTTATANLYAVQRQKGLERDELRKRRAMVRNLQYVSEREAERLRNLSASIEQTRQLEQQERERYRLQQIERQRRITDEIHNIHHHKRNAQGRRRQQHQQRYRQSNDVDASAAVYVSGLPTSATSTAEDDRQHQLEAMLERLFRSYGPLQKVHLYRDKRTRQLKGDGIVVYRMVGVDHTDAANRKQQQQLLISTVCSQVRTVRTRPRPIFNFCFIARSFASYVSFIAHPQMNGAELPCGSVLSVEPAGTTSDADRQYSSGEVSRPDVDGDSVSQEDGIDVACEGRAERAATDGNRIGILTGVGMPTKNSGTADGNAEDDEGDLDEFFNSL